MTAQLLATITCDHPGCPARWPGTAPDADTARQTAGGQNWRRVAGKDFCPRHAWSLPAMTPRQACDPATLEDCSSCGTVMHRGTRRMCAEGHPVRGGAGLCQACRKAALADPATPRLRGHHGHRSRDELLDAWVDLSGIGVGFREFARERGMSFGAWQRAFQRARENHDPRAVRFDRGETAA